jgi:hypothetical protein
MLQELHAESHNDQWVRGAYAVCEMYSRVDAARFEAIVERLASDNQRTALADGARWLLTRWHATQQQPPSRLGDTRQPRA